MLIYSLIDHPRIVSDPSYDTYIAIVPLIENIVFVFVYHEKEREKEDGEISPIPPIVPLVTILRISYLYLCICVFVYL